MSTVTPWELRTLLTSSVRITRPSPEAGTIECRYSAKSCSSSTLIEEPWGSTAAWAGAVFRGNSRSGGAMSITARASTSATPS